MIALPATLRSPGALALQLNKEPSPQQNGLQSILQAKGHPSAELSIPPLMIQGTKSTSGPVVFWPESLEIIRRYRGVRELHTHLAYYYFNLARHNGWDLPRALGEADHALRRWDALSEEDRAAIAKERATASGIACFLIANLYKSRWQVELFFKGIKQHLRIKVFLGTSQNAVRTQIWTAISIYVLVAIIKKELNLSASLYQILQVVSVTIFERVPILRALQLQHTGEKSDLFSNQLSLFNL